MVSGFARLIMASPRYSTSTASTAGRSASPASIRAAKIRLIPPASGVRVVTGSHGKVGPPRNPPATRMPATSHNRTSSQYTGSTWRVTQSAARTAGPASGSALSPRPGASRRSSESAPAPRTT